MLPVDLAIVGAGPVGLAAGIEARRRGLAARLFDKGTITESIVRFPREVIFFSEARNVEIGGHPFVSTGPKPTRPEALKYYRRVAEVEGLDVRTYTTVTALAGEEGVFRLTLQDRLGNEAVQEAAFALIATGYYDRPNRLEVPGEALPHVRHRYDEAAPYWGREVAVVGGSNSAVETALDLYRGGARVTLVHRGPDVRPSVKYWLRPDFENRVREGSIRTVYDAEIEEITPRHLVVTRHGRREEVATDFVVVAIGYWAADELLRQAGARFDSERPVLSERFETSVAGLFVAGSAGFGTETRTVFIENGREHAALAVAEMARRRQGGSK